MANPLDKIRKLKGRSLKEIRERGGQVFSVYTEQIGLSGKLPTDEEFQQLLDKSFFGGNAAPSDENLREAFFKHGKSAFFQSFAQKEKTLRAFQNFGAEIRTSVIDKADRIVEGKFDLLGYTSLDFDTPVDWHFEPIANKRLPLKHWKQFDELDSTESGDKKIVWELNRHQHFFTLGLAYWLTGDERYAETFALHLESWMEQNPPGSGINWFSSLEVAFRAISWLWAFHFFEDSANLSPALFRKALKFLYIHARHIEKYLSTYYSPNTHLTGEALGLFYLGTQLAFFERATQWRETGERILFAELDRQIFPDGVYFEQSTWYARYTADFYTHFLILKALTGDETKRETEEKLAGKLQLLLNYLMHMTRPDGTTPLVGDDDGGRSLPFGYNQASDDFRAVLATGAVIFERGDYKFVAQNQAQETLWLLGGEGIESFADLGEMRPIHTSKAFTDGGYFVMRDGWDETDNYFLIDCGNVGALTGGHGHADTLAFDMAIGGKTMLVDAGTYTYHESEELRSYFRSSEAHNSLTIDHASSSQSSGKFSWRTMAKPHVASWVSENRFDFFEGSHDGYRHLPNTPATHARSVLFLKNDYIILRDFVETRGEHDYQLNFHFNAATDPKITDAPENGGFYVDEETDKYAGLRLCTIGDNGNWMMKEGFVSDCYGRKKAAPFLQFQSKGTAAQEFFTFLLPTDSLSEKPEVLETEMPGGRAFAVKFRGYTDIFVYADGEQMIRTEFFDADFRFVWARLSEGEDAPEEFVLLDGKRLVINNREIVNYPQRLKFAAARRLGNKLNVKTSENIFSVSLPVQRAQRYILKNSDQPE